MYTLITEEDSVKTLDKPPYVVIVQAHLNNGILGSIISLRIEGLLVKRLTRGTVLCP